MTSLELQPVTEQELRAQLEPLDGLELTSEEQDHHSKVVEVGAGIIARLHDENLAGFASLVDKYLNACKENDVPQLPRATSIDTIAGMIATDGRFAEELNLMLRPEFSEMAPTVGRVALT